MRLTERSETSAAQGSLILTAKAPKPNPEIKENQWGPNGNKACLQLTIRAQYGRDDQAPMDGTALIVDTANLRSTQLLDSIDYIRHVKGNTTKFHHRLEDINHSVTQPQTLYIKKIHDILMKYIHSIMLLQLILCPTTFCFKYSLNMPRHRLNEGIYQRLTLAIPYLL